MSSRPVTLTCIGSGVGGADVSYTTWIGNVYGSFTQSGQTPPVIVSAGEPAATVGSSERFKKDIDSDRESQRSNPVIPTGHIPLQDGRQRHTAVRPDRRGGREGESVASAAR